MKQEEGLNTLERMEEKDKDMGLKGAYMSLTKNCMAQKPSLKENSCSVD
jgi:hypothetical protein